MDIDSKELKMDYCQIISSLKKNTFEDASASKLNILNKSNQIIGSLMPVGKWILNDLTKIQSICDWRKKNMRMFLTQFNSSIENTKNYLENLAISEPNRILFLIFDDTQRFIGHIGMANLCQTRGELDNLMRGVNGGNPDLIYFSEVTLLDWCFKELKIIESDVRVISYNWLVISLHEEIGYISLNKIPLKKVVENEIIQHIPTTENESNVNYNCTKMLTTKEIFYNKNEWIISRSYKNH